VLDANRSSDAVAAAVAERVAELMPFHGPGAAGAATATGLAELTGAEDGLAVPSPDPVAEHRR
jgi:hypothetical protein